MNSAKCHRTTLLNYLDRSYWSGCHLNKHNGGSSHLIFKKPECAATSSFAELWPPLGQGEHLSLSNWTEGPFRSSFNLWSPNLSLPATIESPVLTQCFQAYLSTPHHRPLKAGEKLECACSVGNNGRVSDPWPYRPRPFFLDQAQPFDTVGCCSTAWQQKEGKHLLRFFSSRLTPSFFSPPAYIFSLSFVWLEVLLKPGQELKQVARLKFRQQFYNPSFWQLVAAGPNGMGVPFVQRFTMSASILF